MNYSFPEGTSLENINSMRVGLLNTFQNISFTPVKEYVGDGTVLMIQPAGIPLTPEKIFEIGRWIGHFEEIHNL